MSNARFGLRVRNGLVRGITEGFPAIVDADALAFIVAAGITDQTQINAINKLVLDLKGYGLWLKMKCIYPFVGGTALTHRFNLRDPQNADIAFRLSFVGGSTHSATGWQPNGTNGYANTFYVPSVQNTVNSNGFGMYITSRTVQSADPIVLGSFNSSTQGSLINVSATSVSYGLNANGGSALISGGFGSFDAQKTSSTVSKIYKNGILLNTQNLGGTLPTISFFLGNLNVNGLPYGSGWVNNEFRFVYFSEGLNDTEISNLRIAVQAYQTTLGRQV